LNMIFRSATAAIPEDIWMFTIDVVDTPRIYEYLIEKPSIQRLLACMSLLKESHPLLHAEGLCGDLGLRWGDDSPADMHDDGKQAKRRIDLG